MYTIFKTDGTFHCEGRLQDGTERWTKPTLEEAIKSMKHFAKVMNGMKIKKKDIQFFESKEVVERKWVPFNA
jgi:hypothetical protein